jgi:hypothetical protein
VDGGLRNVAQGADHVASQVHLDELGDDY